MKRAAPAGFSAAAAPFRIARTALARGKAYRGVAATLDASTRQDHPRKRGSAKCPVNRGAVIALFRECWRASLVMRCARRRNISDRLSGIPLQRGDAKLPAAGRGHGGQQLFHPTPPAIESPHDVTSIVQSHHHACVGDISCRAVAYPSDPERIERSLDLLDAPRQHPVLWAQFPPQRKSREALRRISPGIHS